MNMTEVTTRPSSTSDAGNQTEAENRSIDVAGDSLVYRRFGNAQTDAPPLLCLQHFRGNLDNWDPRWWTAPRPAPSPTT
jgi:hypothetical protein